MIELIHRTDLSPKQTNYVGTLQFSANALMVVLDDVLDFAKIEAGKLQVHTHTCAPKTLVREVVELFHARGELKGLRLDHSVADDVPEKIRVDSDRLRQILSNLLGNAVKFTDSGSVRVSVSVVGRDEEQCRLRFEVADTGAGIPESAIKQLFEAFSQVDGSFTRKHGGTGLGLAICRKLTQLLGGTIGVESELGKGSRFWFEVPAEHSMSMSSASVLATAATPDLAEKFTGRGLRILVADDNPVNTEILRELVTILGCEVDCVDDGYAAVRAVSEREYTLVLMDCQMPGLDGYEATRMIRAGESNERHLPIIAATAHAFESERARSLQAGMDDHLPKPITIRALAAIIERWSQPVTPGSVAAPAQRPATNEQAALPVLDPEVHRSATVIRVFMNHTPQQLERIQQAIQCSNVQELTQAAHRLKGSCMMFGAARMAQLCLDLERGTGDPNALFVTLTEEHSQLLLALAQNSEPQT